MYVELRITMTDSIESIVLEISSSWKDFAISPEDYYDKKFDSVNINKKISISDLVYKNKYKNLNEIGIQKLKDNDDFISLDNKEKINNNDVTKLYNYEYEDIIKPMSEYIVNYIKKSLKLDIQNNVYYGGSPVGAMAHSLPVYVNLNKEFLKKYDESLF